MDSTKLLIKADQITERVQNWSSKQKIATAGLISLVTMSSLVGCLLVGPSKAGDLSRENLTFDVDASWEKINSPGWTMPLWREEGFALSIERYQVGPFIENYTTPAFNYHGFNESKILFGTPNNLYNGTQLSEWGTNILFQKNGHQTPFGYAHYDPYVVPPADKQEALAMIKTEFDNWVEYINQTNGEPPIGALNCGALFYHYAAEWGIEYLGTELGASSHNNQYMLAFIRGAARQYNKMFYVDVSPWHDNGIPFYADQLPWGEDFSGENYGHSMEYFRRAYTMAYMAGAQILIPECADCNFFLDETNHAGVYELSPLGEVALDFHQFSNRYPDIGIPYTPFGILLEKEHGILAPGFYAKPLAFNQLPYSKGDWMTFEFLNRLWPGGHQIADEDFQLTRSPFGDSFDVLLQQADREVIGAYPVIIPTGDVTFSSLEIENLINYTDDGGVLVLNSAYLDQFPSDFIKENEKHRKISSTIDAYTYGAGNLIVYGPKYSTGELTMILEELSDNFLPFEISTVHEGPFKGIHDLQYMINRRENSWVISVVNNNGLEKPKTEAISIDPRGYRTAHIEFQGTDDELNVISVDEWFTGIEKAPIQISGDKKSITFDLAPGENRIFEFRLN